MAPVDFTLGLEIWRAPQTLLSTTWSHVHRLRWLTRALTCVRGQRQFSHDAMLETRLRYAGGLSCPRYDAPRQQHRRSAVSTRIRQSTARRGTSLIAGGGAASRREPVQAIAEKRKPVSSHAETAGKRRVGRADRSEKCSGASRVNSRCTHCAADTCAGTSCADLAVGQVIVAAALGMRELRSGGGSRRIPELRPRKRAGGVAAHRFNSSTAAAAEAVVGEGSGNAAAFTAAAPKELPRLADAGARAPSG
jgi:hypothetical protein